MTKEMATPDTSAEHAESHRQMLPSLLGVLWAVGFVWVFFAAGPQLSLPDGQITRTQILLSTPELGGRLLDRFVGGDPKTEGWRFVPWELILIALLVCLAATALGRLVLRQIGPQFTRFETNVTAYGLGLSALSLITLGLGLAGRLDRFVFVAILVGAIATELALRVFGPDRSGALPPAERRTPRLIMAACTALCLPMLLMILTGALSPPTDFDVREYHLQGPKEYFQNGQITFLAHNAYTSFPFLTEMLSLLGMVLTGDWYTGALVGKLILASFLPMTAAALIAAGRRLFTPRSGWLAALVFLTTPWVYRISIIAYAEGGLTFYLFLSVLALALFADRPSAPRALVVGLLAGSALACKYPALVSVVIPALLTVLWLSYRSENAESAGLPRAAVLFLAGVSITAGPWLVRNFADTGNPVYPLAWSIFGGEDWTAELNERWKAGHSPPNYAATDLIRRVGDVAVTSNWQSALIFAFLPLALLSREHRRKTIAVLAFALCMFATWWLLTHRIDRFWVPVLPALALLAGHGIASAPGRGTAAVLAVLVGVCCLYNTVFSGAPFGGYNAFLKNPELARREIETRFGRLLLQAEDLNRQSARPGRVLSVGEAAVFEARTDVLYNTVFDLNLFQKICGESVTGGTDANVRLREMNDVRRRLGASDVRIIAVDWREVLRYRAPGSYGFTRFVEPRTFRALVDAGVLRRVEVVEARWQSLSPEQQAIVTDWQARTGNRFVAQEIFEVID